MEKKHILIKIRYSLFSPLIKGSWKIGKADKDDYKKKLFDEKRLELREKIFSRICLPSLVNLYEKKPADVEISIILLSSIDLPKPRKDFLLRISEKHPFISINFFDDEFAFRDFQKIVDNYAEQNMEDQDILVSARLDDDDALSVNWLSDVLKFANKDNLGRILSLSGAVSVLLDNDAKIKSISDYLFLMPSAGLAYIGNKNDYRKDIYNCGNHSNPFRRYPTIVLADKVHCLRSFSSENDSNDEYKERPLKGDPVEILKLYGISMLD